jgi:hypothetical protein
MGAAGIVDTGIGPKCLGTGRIVIGQVIGDQDGVRQCMENRSIFGNPLSGFTLRDEENKNSIHLSVLNRGSGGLSKVGFGGTADET